jgi:hypothetical protein
MLPFKKAGSNKKWLIASLSSLGIRGRVVKVIDFKPTIVGLNPNREFGLFHVRNMSSYHSLALVVLFGCTFMPEIIYGRAPMDSSSTSKPGKLPYITNTVLEQLKTQ